MYRLQAGEKLIKGLPIYVLVLFVLQPCMDVLSYFSNLLGISNIYTSLARLGLLLAVCLLGFLVAKKKKMYIITAAVLGVYTLLHVIACMRYGYNDPLSDLINLTRIFQMPVFVICFITFIKANNRVYDAIKLGFAICLLIIAAVEIFSVISGTNPYTYTNKNIGIIGWFNDGSAQSAILSTVVPVFMASAITKFKNKPILLLLSVAGGCLILYMYATRLSYLALLATLLGLLITLLITDRKAVTRIAALGIALITFLCLMPVSPMQQNLDMVGDNAVKKQALIDELIAEAEAEAIDRGLKGDDLKAARLETAYQHYLGGITGRFGLEETVRAYNYSEKASDICDARRIKKTYCSMLMEEQGVSALLFGMELSDMTYEGQIHDVENDFHGIFYLTGTCGLVLLLVFLGYFIFMTLKALISDFKKVFDTESAGWGIALCVNMLHAYATCGVLRRPGSSFYLCAILAIIPYLISQKKGRKYDN